MGSGCGSVGRAVASKSRGPQFESRHGQKIYIEHFTVNCIENTKIKKKRPGMAHLNRKNEVLFACLKWNSFLCTTHQDQFQ